MKDGESWKSVNQEEREKIRKDPDYCQLAFERILGQPSRPYASPNGYFIYECPFAGCFDAHHPHLGIRYERDLSQLGSKCGRWSCQRCGEFGIDFFAFCDALNKDPKDYLSDLELAELSPRKKVDIIEVDPAHFAAVWSWIYDHSPDPDRDWKDQMYSRGVELNRTTNWFMMPEKKIFNKAIDFFGDDYCLEAGILRRDPEDDSIRFTNLIDRERLAIVYPQDRFNLLEFSYVRSYEPGTRPKMRGPGAYSLRPYTRIHPDGRYIAILEGEIKPEASYQAGVSAIGAPGLFNCHKMIAELIKEHAIRTQKYPIVCIIMDTETKLSTIVDVARAKSRIYDTIVEVFADCPRRLFPDIRIGSIPLIPGSEKTDTDDFIKHRAIDSSLREARRDWREFIISV